MHNLKHIDLDYRQKGDVSSYPLFLIDMMVEEQVAQGNKANVEVFEKNRYSTQAAGGFDFEKSIYGPDFWHTVITFENISAGLQLLKSRIEEDDVKVKTVKTIPTKSLIKHNIKTMLNDLKYKVSEGELDKFVKLLELDNKDAVINYFNDNSKEFEIDGICDLIEEKYERSKIKQKHSLKIEIHRANIKVRKKLTTNYIIDVRFLYDYEGKRATVPTKIYTFNFQPKLPLNAQRDSSLFDFFYKYILGHEWDNV